MGRRPLSLAAAALLLAGCGSGNGSGAPEMPPIGPGRVSSGKITHVVIVVQENRSFNNLFLGYPGAKTQNWGYDTKGHRVELRPIGLEAGWDLTHNSTSFFEACNGTGTIPGTRCRMNGFDQEYAACAPDCPIPHPQYAYVPRNETQPYFDIARQYVLADRMYASNFDASSFISHQYIIAAQAQSAVNFPFGYWGCPGGPNDMIAKVSPRRHIPHGYEVVCWNPTTLGDELDGAGISWAYYAAGYSSASAGSIWSAYEAIEHIYKGPDWHEDVVTPPARFLTDVAHGKLRSVSWVTPTWTNSDHAGSGSKTGPSWVASLVNAIGESKYWNSTAMFIFWDDYGGWYDPEAPPYADYDGLGLRLPLLIVSAYAKRGYVSHVRYEHGSILKFAEDQLGLARLSASDIRANSPEADAFDFTKPPRKFVKIRAPYDRGFFLQQPIDPRLPDSE